MRTIDYFMILCAGYPFLYIRHTLSVISDLFIRGKVNARYRVFPGNFLVFALEFLGYPKIHFELVCETVKLILCTADSKCELIQG